MAGPWEKYQNRTPALEGPWRKYQSGESVSTVEDVAKSGATGVRRGLESAAGILGDVNAINQNVIGKIAEWFGASPETAGNIGTAVKYLNPATAFMPTTEQVKEHLSQPLMGEEYKPATTAGEYARTIGEFLPAAAVGPGGAGQRILSQAMLPGLASEAAGQMTEGTAWEPYARIGGAVGGAMLPSVARRAITPFPSNSPERQAAVDTLRKEGVDLTAGQSTGSQGLKYRESELGGAAGAAFMEKQGEQFTKAALKRAGIDAQRATPEVINDAFTKIGRQFDELAARNNIVPDRQLVADIQGTFNEYGQLVPQASRAPIVESITNDVVSAIRQGGISGEAYQSLTSRLARSARGTSDPELGTFFRSLRENLDDAMERSIAASNPADMGAWQEARSQYRNMLVLEKAATGAGENAALGLISPSQLRNATVNQGRRAYARGKGDFADLARAGEAVMKPLPQSGTAPRLMAQGGGSAASAAIGALLGGPGGAAAGAVVGATLPRLIGGALLSGPGRAYLTNQIMNAGKSDPRIAAIISALMAGGGQRSLPPPQ